MSAYGRFFARFYDLSLARGERAGMGDLRAAVLADSRGDVLEIGAGTGLNLGHYPQSVSSLTLTDPEAPMVSLLRKTAAGHPLEPRIMEAPAEALPVEDDSFDTVVSTLVLCTVPDVPSTLDEVRRVLRPGGQLLIVEHVRGDESLARWQNRFHGPWKAVGYGCHCNRDTSAALADAGFDTANLRSEHWKTVPAIVAPLIAGPAAPF